MIDMNRILPINKDGLSLNLSTESVFISWDKIIDDCFDLYVTEDKDTIIVGDGVQPIDELLQMAEILRQIADNIEMRIEKKAISYQTLRINLN